MGRLTLARDLKIPASWPKPFEPHIGKVISEIKQIQKYRKQPLWNIEALWRGYQ